MGLKFRNAARSIRKDQSFRLGRTALIIVNWYEREAAFESA